MSVEIKFEANVDGFVDELSFSITQGCINIKIAFSDRVSSEEIKNFLADPEEELLLETYTGGGRHRIFRKDYSVIFEQTQDYTNNMTSITVPLQLCSSAFQDWIIWLNKPEIEYFKESILSYEQGCLQMDDGKYNRYALAQVDSWFKLGLLINGGEERVYCSAGTRAPWHFYIEKKDDWFRLVCGYDELESGGSGFAIPFDKAVTALKSMYSVLFK